MPVEIKELVIRMSDSHSTSAGNASTSTGANHAPAAVDQEAIVEACVKAVLKILEKKKAR
jgi:hypothetical protein